MARGAKGNREHSCGCWFAVGISGELRLCLVNGLLVGYLGHRAPEIRSAACPTSAPVTKEKEKLQDTLDDRLCVARKDAAVVETMLNPNGKPFIKRLGHGVAPAGAMTMAAAEVVVIGSVTRLVIQSRHGSTDRFPELRLAGIVLKGCYRLWCPDWPLLTTVMVVASGLVIAGGSFNRLQSRCPPQQER